MIRAEEAQDRTDDLSLDMSNKASPTTHLTYLLKENFMTDEKQINEAGTVVDNTDYIEAIQTLKQNSVDREKYDALRAENKKLLESIVNGQTIEVQATEQYRDVNEIRDELFNHEHTNLDYAKLALELRSTLIAKGERDPFLPYGTQIAPTAEDEAAAEKVAQIYQECIDYADGDPRLFTQELQRRTNPSIYDRIKK